MVAGSEAPSSPGDMVLLYNSCSCKTTMNCKASSHKLMDNDIVSTNGASFTKSVLQATNHCGVDVTINFTTRDEFENSLEVIASFGRLIDTATDSGLFQKTLTPEVV